MKRVIYIRDYFRKPRIHFVNFIDVFNTGDFYASPLFYFPQFLEMGQCINHNLSKLGTHLIFPGDTIIIGGGGLFNNSSRLNTIINNILSLAEGNRIKVFGWGIGDHSRPERIDNNMERIAYEKFHLLGIRDYNFPLPEGVSAEYVPCVTCMSEYFDKSERLIRKVGVIEHSTLDIENPDIYQFQRIRNSGHISQQIKFIKSSEYIVTNSYHAALWGTLIGKPVILMDYSWASKFNYFERSPFRYSGNIQSDINTATGQAPHIEDARRINVDFFNRIVEALES